MNFQQFTDRQILITGCAGFLGTNLAQALLQSGAKVIGVDNFITGQQSNIDYLTKLNNDHFNFIKADVNSPIDSWLSKDKLDYIFHFASPASPPKYQQSPILTYRVNSYATDQLLQYIKQTSPQCKFIFASTSEVYGDPIVHPQPETYFGNVNPNGIRSCYDESKRLGETICGVYHRQHDLDTRIVRIFNTYGPRMDPNDGRVITNFVNQALENKALSIYGDGSQTRSYCYVDDLISGILTVASADNNKAKGKTFNVGNPEEFTIKKTAEIIVGKINPQINDPFDYKPLPKDDPTRRCPDISKIKDQLGWEPQISFEQGLAKTIEYYRNLLK